MVSTPIALMCMIPTIIFGLMLMFTDLDWYWEIQKMINDSKGVKSERTYGWEMSSRLSGFVLLIIAIIITMIVITQ